MKYRSIIWLGLGIAVLSGIAIAGYQQRELLQMEWVLRAGTREQKIKVIETADYTNSRICQRLLHEAVTNDEIKSDLIRKINNPTVSFTEYVVRYGNSKWRGVQIFEATTFLKRSRLPTEEKLALFTRVEVDRQFNHEKYQVDSYDKSLPGVLQAIFECALTARSVSIENSEIEGLDQLLYRAIQVDLGNMDEARVRKRFKIVAETQFDHDGRVNESNIAAVSAFFDSLLDQLRYLLVACHDAIERDNPGTYSQAYQLSLRSPWPRELACLSPIQLDQRNTLPDYSRFLLRQVRREPWTVLRSPSTYFQQVGVTEYQRALARIPEAYYLKYRNGILPWWLGRAISFKQISTSGEVGSELKSEYRRLRESALDLVQRGVARHFDHKASACPGLRESRDFTFARQRNRIWSDSEAWTTTAEQRRIVSLAKCRHCSRVLNDGFNQ